MTREQVLSTLRGILARSMKLAPEELDIYESLPDMGVSSLMLVDTLRQVQDIFGVRPSTRKVLDQYWTVDTCTDYLMDLLRQKGQEGGPPPSRREQKAIESRLLHGPAARLPLLAMQKQLGFLAHLAEGAGAAFREMLAVSLRGTLDIAVLREALAEVVQRHGALRTRLVLHEEAQEVASLADYEITSVDFSTLAAERAQREASAWLEAEARRSVDLDGQLLHVTALKLDPSTQILVLAAHTTIADRRALHLILGELGRLYSVRMNRMNRSAVEIPRPGSYEEHVRMLHHKEQIGGFQSAEGFWIEELKGTIPRVELPADRLRPPMQSYQGARLVTVLPHSLLELLQKRSGEQGATLYQLLLAAFTALIHRLTGEQEVVIGISGRETVLDEHHDHVFANRTDLLPMRALVDGDAPFDKHLRATREKILDMSEHAGYPFALLVRRLNPDRDLARSPVFVVAFEAERAARPHCFDDLDAAYVTAPSHHVRYDLHVTYQDLGGAVQLQCDYSTDLFDRQTVRRWMACLKALLARIAETPATRIHELPMLLEEDRRLLDAWNATEAGFPEDQCIHQLFEGQVERRPDATAVIFEGTQLSYRELDRRANRLAHLLRRRGVGPNVPVALFTERSLEMCIGLLGILKAGGAYVPLDTRYPRERLGFMLSDACAPVLITQEALIDRLPDHGAHVITLDPGGTWLLEERADSCESGVSPADLAYIIYTSGSTGKPKGVEVPHRGVVSILKDSERVHDVDSSGVVVSIASVSFDIFVTELFLGLGAGAEVVMVSEEVCADGARLAELIDRSKTTYLQATPATWQMLLDAGWQGRSSLTAISTGDALSQALAERIMPRVKVLWNAYGPTEASIWATRTLLSPGAGVSIGKPVANTQIHLLDRHLKPVPVGVHGEMYIGGAGVTRGYLRRPELTTERFVPDPFSKAPHARLYRTGDLARYRPNGDVEFLGRLDHQVKLRGFRIELGEIDAALRRHPAVREAVTVLRAEEPSGGRLVSYVVPAASPPASAELRELLRVHLPDYMVPATFVLLDAMPLNANGKIDRGALPAPASAGGAPEEGGYAAPTTPLEQSLESLWSEMLRVPRVGRHDDFFVLGGHSLLISQMVVRIRQEFDVGVGPRDFFDTPTIEQLAVAIANKRAEPTRGSTPEGRGVRSQSNVAARERFAFLRSEAVLDPTLRPSGPAHVPSASPEHLLLTGATGFVGSYLLRELLDRSRAQIHCLVRATSPEEGRKRILQNLTQWKLRKEGDERRLIPVLGELTRPRLGLDEAAFEALGARLDLVVHSAAMVKFLHPYRTLKQANVVGTQEIIRLACAGRTKPLHYVSTAAVFPMGRHNFFREDSSLDHDFLLNLSYDETKWVAEHLVVEAQQRGLPAAIYRMGEICGDSGTGQSVFDHLAFALVKGALQLKAFPSVMASFDLVPVDYVAKALAHIALQPGSVGRAYHLNNPKPTDEESTYGWLRRRGYRFDVMPYDAWRRKLLDDPGLVENALYPFIGLFEEFEARNIEFPFFDSSNTQNALQGSDVRCVPTYEMLPVIFDFFCNAGFFPAPDGAASAPPRASG